jgi:hypothetical protein
VKLQYTKINLNNGDSMSLTIENAIENDYLIEPKRVSDKWYVVYRNDSEIVVAKISIANFSLTEVYKDTLYNFYLNNLVVQRNFFGDDYVYLVNSNEEIYYITGPDSLEYIGTLSDGSQFLYDAPSAKTFYLKNQNSIRSFYLDSSINSNQILYSKKFLGKGVNGIDFGSGVFITSISKPTEDSLTIVLGTHTSQGLPAATHVIFKNRHNRSILLKDRGRGYTEGVSHIFFLTQSGNIKSIHHPTKRESTIGHLGCDGILLDDLLGQNYLNFVVKSNDGTDCKDFKLKRISDRYTQARIYQLK